MRKSSPCSVVCIYKKVSNMEREILTASQGRNGRRGKEGLCTQNVCLFSRTLVGIKSLFCPELLKGSLMPHLDEKCRNYLLG